MATWEDYKNHVRKTNPYMREDIDEIEARAKIIGAMIDQRHALNISQRELAKMCNLPHSSVARIESGKSAPNLNTLLKIFDKLNLTFSIQRVGPKLSH